MPPTLSWEIIFAVLVATVNAVPTIHLGSCGYFHATTRIYQVMDYAAKVAFEEGLFDDVVRNRNFNIEISAVNTRCSSSVAASVSLPLLMGTGDVDGRIYSLNTSEPVVAISGCGCSSSTKMVSDLGNPYEVTVVSGAATSVHLSDKSSYPFFARTVPPDSMQGVGLARLVAHFGWQRVVLLYPQEDYASDIATVFREQIAAHTSGVTLFREPVLHMPLRAPDDAASYNYSEIVAVASRVAQLRPQPRVFVMPANYRDVGPLIRAFAEQGLAGPQSVWFFSESACSVSSLRYIANNQADFMAASPANSIFAANDTFDWSGIPDLLRGMVCLSPIARGARYRSSAWHSFWTNLTREKLLAAGMPPAHHSEPSFFADFGILEGKIYNTLIFDAMTTLIVAIGDLIDAGIAATNIRGGVLRDAVYAARFEGLSGNIGFDGNGNRPAPYDIMNLQRHDQRRLQASGEVSTLVQVGSYDGLPDVVTLAEPVLFGTGTAEVPSDRPAPCGLGEEYVGSRCAACPPGKRAEEVDSVCSDCLAGYFAASQGMSACTPAPLGSFVPRPGSDQSIHCSQGTFQQETGSTACQSCLPGSAQGRVGQPLCEICDIGQYASQGAIACEHCPGMLTTEHVGSTSPLACKCPVNFYAASNDSLVCTPCEEGMFCAFGVSSYGLSPLSAADDDVPLLLPGYFSKVEDPVSVFRCRSKEACPGGLPGTCGYGRTGVACGRCPTGEVSTEHGACNTCSAHQGALPFMGLLCMVALCIFVYYRENHKLTVNATASLAITLVFSILVTDAQLLSTFGSLTAPWPSSVSGVSSSMSILAFDPKQLAIECLVGTSAVSRYWARVSVPFILVTLFLGSWLLSQAAPATSRLRWTFDKTLNSMGTALQICFVALCGIVAIPWICYTHPNARRSVLAFPDVLCFEGDDSHIAMGFGSAVLVFVIIVPFLALNMWASTRVLATKLESKTLVRFRYLFYRFRPDVWWWGNVFMLRQLLLAFAPMVSPDDPDIQVVYLSAVFIIYLCAVCAHWPWKSHELNILDVVSVACLQLMVIAVGTRIPVNEESKWQSPFMLAMLAVLVVPGCVIFAGAMATVLRRGPGSEFGWGLGLHRKRGAAELLAEDLRLMGDLLGALEPGSCEEIVRRMNIYDREALSATMSSIQGATMSEVWISSNVAPRLTGIQHSNAQLETAEQSGALARQVTSISVRLSQQDRASKLASRESESKAGLGHQTMEQFGSDASYALQAEIAQVGEEKQRDSQVLLGSVGLFATSSKTLQQADAEEKLNLEKCQETCVCGNVFMPDSIFCRKCGKKRPQETCVCGNVFTPDAIFCSMCGTKRTQVMAATAPQDEIDEAATEVMAATAPQDVIDEAPDVGDLDGTGEEGHAEELSGTAPNTCVNLVLV